VVAGVFPAKAPEHTAAGAIEVHWFVTFGAVTATAATTGLTAAIVIGHEVVTPVHRIETGANPGDR